MEYQLEQRLGDLQISLLRTEGRYPTEVEKLTVEVKYLREKIARLLNR